MILFMGVGYSILATRLSIKGVAKTTGKWQIEIVGIEPIENNTSAVSRDAKIINPTTVELIIAIIPVLIAAGLVMPVRNYHNVMQLLNNMLDFYTNTRKYYWKGWCVKDDTDE